MASPGVLPWLVGLPATDTSWDVAPAPARAVPAQDTLSATDSPKSEPGTLRSRVQDATDGTVNRRSQSSSPMKQPSLAWRSRLINGQTSYGDQTDLFGPSGLESIFTKKLADSSGPQKKQRAHMNLRAALSSDHDFENISPSKDHYTKPALPLSIPSSPPLAHYAHDKHSSEDSADASPTSQSSQSSVADMLSEMMGKIDELNISNKGYHTRMQAIKERLNESDELRFKLEQEKQQARYQKDKGSAELLKAQKRLFDSTKQTISAEQRADLAKSERRQLAEDYNTSKRALNLMRGEADEWRGRYEEAQSELESLRSASPKSATSDNEAHSPQSEVIPRQPNTSPPQDDESQQGSMIIQNTNAQNNIQADAGAERNTESEQHTLYHTAQPKDETQDVTGSRSITDSELEDLTPVLIAKRFSSTGKVHFNAIRSENAARTEIYKQRKEIDKTETSQRAREVELAIGTEQSETNEDGQSTPDRTKAGDQAMGSNDTSVADANDDSEWQGARHVSGFTDAPEVEEDMPVTTKQPDYSGNWEFSEPPQNESSELAAAHRHGESANKRSVSFGLQELNDYAFTMADQALEDASEATVDGPDGALSSMLDGSVQEHLRSRNSSPASDVQAPGSRIPFAFRKDSLSEIDSGSAKPKRNPSKGSASVPIKSPLLSLPRTRPSPPRAINGQNLANDVASRSRSPPRVYIEDASDDMMANTSAMEGKRPLPRSPLKSPTPKRRRTLHDSELQLSVSEANLSYHSQLQEAIGTREHQEPRRGEKHNVAKPSVLAQRKMAKARSATPSQGPATSDYINEAKKVIELLRGNQTSSSALGGITEADEDETYENLEEDDGQQDPPYNIHNTHKSDNMRTLAPQQVAHLIGGEMHGMLFDRNKNCWVRSKSSEHKQFLDPRDALSSDDDPFREISDLTVEKSVRIHVTRPSLEATVVHHELDEDGLSFGDQDNVPESEREDTPQKSNGVEHGDLKLPGEDTTLAHYNEAHSSDPSELTPTNESSTSVLLPSHITFPSPPNRDMPIDIARLQISITNTNTDSNANINNTFMLSDLPEFTVHEEDHERPSERALAKRLARYTAVQAIDPYAVASTELVKAITDVQGPDMHWEDLTSLCLRDRSLRTLHNLDGHCARVEKLDASGNALTQLDGIPPFVRQLNVRSNQLISLTSWAHLMHLQYLDVSSNDLESLDGLGHLIHLRELRVDNNRIRRLDGIADLDGLITLSVRNNAIREVNFENFKFGRVVELDISENEIANVKGLASMSSLRTLRLDKNSLNKALEVTAVMPRLKHLSANSCGIWSLDVTRMPNLRTLEIDDNSLNDITGLGRLKKLDLLSMRAQTLSDGKRIKIFDHPLEAQNIRLARNYIPELQLDHAFMTVKHLELSDTGLVSLPANFGIQFTNLRSLDLSYNGLRDIRPLAPLIVLESLNVVGCRIERLRKTVATIGKLEKLRNLDMKNNPLTQGFYGPEASEDRMYKGKLDDDTRIRRRTYELLMAYSCTHDGFTLDGLPFDAKLATAKDLVWERLVELGVLREV